MRALVVFYSRTGHTRKVALEIAKVLKCDTEEISEPAGRSGILGYIKSGYEASRAIRVHIRKPEHDPSKYGLVVVGTPVWGWNVSSPVRAYLSANSGKLRKAAFFCACGGQPGKAFESMERAAGARPVATLKVTESDVASGVYKEKAREFAAFLMRA